MPASVFAQTGADTAERERQQQSGRLYERQTTTDATVQNDAAADLGHLTPGTRVSLSIGVAQLRPGMSARDLFETADRQLYRAKRGGRDRVAA